jgi:hypothetical protein
MQQTTLINPKVFSLPALTPEELEKIKELLATKGKCHVNFKYGRYGIFKSIPKGCHWVTIGGKKLPTIPEALAELTRLCHLATLTRAKRQTKLSNARP